MTDEKKEKEEEIPEPEYEPDIEEVQMSEDDYDYYSEPDENEEEEDNPSCVEGYCADECCMCVGREGIETCDFMCPFGGADKRCDDETRKKCEEEYYKEQEELEKSIAEKEVK